MRKGLSKDLLLKCVVDTFSKKDWSHAFILN